MNYGTGYALCQGLNIDQCVPYDPWCIETLPYSQL